MGSIPVRDSVIFIVPRLYCVDWFTFHVRFSNWNCNLPSRWTGLVWWCDRLLLTYVARFGVYMWVDFWLFSPCSASFFLGSLFLFSREKNQQLQGNFQLRLKWLPFQILLFNFCLHVGNPPSLCAKVLFNRLKRKWTLLLKGRTNQRHDIFLNSPTW